MIKNLKNKKVISIILIIIFIILYYIFFTQSNIDGKFSAEDLKVKTIDNKKDFENIIVKNIYKKIVKSCKKKKKKAKYYNEISKGGIEYGRGGGSTNLFSVSENKEDMMIMGNSSSSFGLDSITKTVSIKEENHIEKESLSIPSISFNGKKENNSIAQSVSFSETNVQKKSVDEGDIFKQTKNYIFYFSKNKSKIYIIKSPINGEKIDLKNIKAVYTIDIPSDLSINPELFVNENRLIYLASKKAYNNNNTIVGIYDISNLENSEVSLLKIFETKGEYFKSRLIDKNLYLISNYSISPFKDKFCNIVNKEKSGFSEFVSFFTGIELEGFGTNKELFNELKEELESYSYKFNGNNLSGKGKQKKLEDFKIFYTEKDLSESIENLNFNVISVVDIESNTENSKQSLVFGNLKNGEIHMTLDNLYLVNSYHKEEKWKCDYIDICYKEFSSNNFTSVSKLSYSGNKFKYLKTSIIPGKPLNQYSMDEDEGYFRIFTAHNSGNRDAALYVFDKKFKLIGELEDIKPGEEFKSSRFIGNKAFLVTFRQRDPLFVVDLHIPATPKIIGELHIPGYSSYLHPYGKVGNKEYLIGIGKNNSNVKVDLYEIDYEKLGIGKNIDVKQKYSYTFNGNSSKSPAETNPRTFVWDKKEKLLFLPIKIDDYYEQYTEFTGLKTLKIEIDNPIKLEESHKTSYANIMNSRAGYYKTLEDKTTFFVSDGFISFFGKNEEEKKIDFR